MLPCAEKEFNVNTFDIDIAGHLNNIVYLKWMEELRNVLFEDILNFPKIIKDGFYPVVISTSIKYREEIKFNEKPIGKIKLSEYKHGVIRFQFEFIVNDSIASRAVQKCVVMNLKKSKMVIDQNIKKRVELQKELPVVTSI
jgi:acyl-CoA thioester hydrolase